MESGRPKQALRDVSNVKKASAATPGKPRATPGRKWAATPSHDRVAAAADSLAARLDENNGWSDELRVACQCADLAAAEALLRAGVSVHTVGELTGYSYAT
jgi:hypothetical protein